MICRNASANFHKHGIAIYREIIGIFYITSYPVISLSLYVDLGSEWLWKAGELIQSIYTANVYRGLWGVHKFSLHWPWQPYKWLILMVGLSLTPKWSKPVLFVEWFIKNPIFLLISSVGGCQSQPMLLFWKLVDETQISKPPEATRH